MAVFSAAPFARSAPPRRPPIVGVANFAAKAGDLAAARKFYTEELGYQEAFTLRQPGGGPDLICFKVNDRQYVEIAPELKDPNEDRLIQVGFETTDARKLRDYLASKHVEVPAKVKPGADGNLSFTVKDPDGHTVEFIQYLPRSIHSRNFGKFMPATRVSNHILHVGVLVKDRAAADAFYKEILGFRLLWEGGPEGRGNIYISMMVPDGGDWVEYMTGNSNPPPKVLGVLHHFALEVSDVQATIQTVTDRGYKLSGNKAHIGRDGRSMVDFYDPDHTRAEIQVRKPVQTPCCSPWRDPYITMDTGAAAKGN